MAALQGCSTLARACMAACKYIRLGFCQIESGGCALTGQVCPGLRVVVGTHPPPPPPSLQDYYPTVAINALMRVLRDPAMATQHMKVIDALMTIFRSLSLAAVPYLPKVCARMRVDPHLRRRILLLCVLSQVSSQSQAEWNSQARKGAFKSGLKGMDRLRLLLCPAAWSINLVCPHACCYPQILANSRCSPWMLATSCCSPQMLASPACQPRSDPLVLLPCCARRSCLYF